MNVPRTRSIAALVAIVAILLVPTGLVGGAPAPSAAVPTHPPLVPIGHAIRPATPRPAITCPVPPFGYSNVGPFLPPNPSFNFQVPCPGPISQDMVVGTFSSSAPGSAERFTEPVYLPRTGSPGQSFAFNDIYVGMVVGGDPGSAFHQSYAELIFTPQVAGVNATENWSLGVAVFSIRNESANSQACGPKTVRNMSVIWNDSLWCVADEVHNGSGFLGPSPIPGGTWYNVTFAGQKGGSAGLAIWANDSTNSTSANNLSFQLNATNTQTFPFEPFYNASCPDTCFLNWSFPFGLGVGIGICPPGFNGGCNSYNQTTWDGLPTPGFGIPQYFVSPSAGYSGDYGYFAPMSGSAECSSSAVVPVATCPEFNFNGGTGFYPYFSWNGSQLNFGDGRPYTVDDLGGEYTEYIQNGPIQHDLVPTFLDKVSNDSRAGYIRPGLALNISASVSDLGTVRGVAVLYTLNSGTPTNLTMTRLSGTAQRGVYNATVPIGANGWINYTVIVTNNASFSVTSQKYTVYRGALPTFQVYVTTVPASCTNATINGTVYPNGSVLSLPPGTYPVSSTSCFPYQFSYWQTTAGLRVTVTNGSAGNLSLSRSGNLTPVWHYVRPLVTVQFLTTPLGCGSVQVNSVSYLPGQNVSLRAGISGSVSNLSGCGGESFAGWTLTGNVTLVGSTLTAGGNGTLTANYIATASGVTLTFDTNPTICGAVLYRGVGYTEGSTLVVNSTSYPVAPDPCAHFGFYQFVTSGGASISNGSLTVTSPGTVLEQNQVLTEVTIVTSPSYCTVSFDGVREQNGTVLVLGNNTTHIVSQNPCTGHYAFSMTVTPGMSLFGNVLTVNDSGTLFGVWLPGTAPSSFLEFQTDPGTCGSINFLGARWYDTNYTNVAANTSGAVSGSACPGYGFVRWQWTGGVIVHSGVAYVNSSGSLEAVFRPLANVGIQTTPSWCGSVVLNGAAYTSNASAQLTEDYPYSVAASPCAHYSFSGWSATVGAIIVGATVYLSSDAIVTAVFVPTPYNVTVLVSPAGCGSLYLNGVSETNGTSLNITYGTYPTHAAPCLGDVLQSLAGTGGVSVVGSNVTVGANGTLVAIYEPIPPSLTLQVPTGSLAGDSVLLAATVAVPVPPYTYNYAWKFGDGGSVTTPANFTQHTYQSPGNYVVTVTVVDPYNRTTSASQTIDVVANNGAGTTKIPTSTLVILGVAALAIAALVGVALWRRGRPPAAPAAEGTSPSGSADEPPAPDEYTMAAPPPEDMAGQGSNTENQR
ncbi:MAG TPA: PKD domain-containing protein [Thermoplasmata archaeon]|nr:PKD domain-containing protein [Thermoplasmata archaeon]